MTAYNPPNNTLPNFNPAVFEPYVASGGLTEAEITTLNTQIDANNVLIASIQNSLLNLGGTYTIKSLSGIMSPNTGTTITSVSLAPGTYVLSYNITFSQNPPSTSVWTTAQVNVNTGGTGANANYTQTLNTPNSLSTGNAAGAISGACFCVYTTTTTLNLSLTILSATSTTNSWQYGSLGYTPVSPFDNPSLNCFRLVRLK